MFGLGADREILRIHLQRRLLLAGAHAARPRHPRRLRAIEVGDGEIVGARAAGTARHGDDGLARMLPSLTASLRAKRSNPDYFREHSLDCFVAGAPRNDGNTGFSWH